MTASTVLSDVSMVASACDVELGAAFQQFPDPGEGVGCLEQGPVLLVLDPLEDHLGPRRQADHETGLLEGLPVRSRGSRLRRPWRPPGLPLHDVADDPLLDLPEMGLA